MKLLRTTTVVAVLVFLTMMCGPFQGEVFAQDSEQGEETQKDTPKGQKEKRGNRGKGKKPAKKEAGEESDDTDSGKGEESVEPEPGPEPEVVEGTATVIAPAQAEPASSQPAIVEGTATIIAPAQAEPTSSQPAIVEGQATITEQKPSSPVVEAAVVTPDAETAPPPTASDEPATATNRLIISGPADSSPMVIPEGAPLPVLQMQMVMDDYHSKAGNFMLDGWAGPSRPLLEEAAALLLNKRGVAVNAESIRALESELQSDPVTRWQFAPFMLRTTYASMMAKQPTAAQQAFLDRFAEYAAWDDMYIARRTLEMWNRHIGADQIVGPPTEYQAATLSVLLDTGPSIQGFLPLDNPLFLGDAGQAALTLLYKPMNAHNLPEFDDTEHLRGLDDEMTKTAIAAGLGGAAGAAAAATAAIGVTPAVWAVNFATNTINAQVNVATSGLTGEAAKIAGREAAKRAGAEFAKILGKHISTKILSGAVGPVLGGAAFFASVMGTVLADFIETREYDAALRQRAFNLTPLDAREYLGDYPSVAKRTQMFTLLVKMLIADPADSGKLTLALPEWPCQNGHLREAAGGTCVLAVRFHSQNNLSLDQAQQLAFNNSWRLATAEELQNAFDKLGYQQYAYGRLADGRFAVPVQAATGNFAAGTNIGVTGGNQGFFHVPRVEWKEWEGLSQAQAEAILGHEGHRLATAEEIQKAWEKKVLNINAYGRISDGRFAVPIQQSNGTLGPGTNIGATGGNQGFFFVQNAANTPKGMYYRGQQALQCAPGTVQEAGLCYTQCEAGYKGIATRCYQGCPGGFRDDGLYCAKPEAYSREGFAWQPGDPPLPNYSGPIARCEAKYQSCEQWGALIYPQCKSGFHAVGCCLCSPSCPSGFNDIGVSCQKPFYDRGVGRAIDSCPAGSEKIGALCYPLCNKGFRGQLDWCYKD